MNTDTRMTGASKMDALINARIAKALLKMAATEIARKARSATWGDVNDIAAFNRTIADFIAGSRPDTRPVFAAESEARARRTILLEARIKAAKAAA
jgi:hypothetical protein